MSTRQWKPTEERRVEIADAALRVIATKGIAAFTMEQLAQEIGLSAGSLFRHFRSKQEILGAAVDRAVSLLRLTFSEPGLPALERLHEFFLARTRLVGNSAGIAQLMFSEQFFKALDEDSRKNLSEITVASQAFIGEVIAAGQACGDIRRDLPPEDLARLTMGAAFASIFLQQAQEESSEQIWNTLSTVLRP